MGAVTPKNGEFLDKADFDSFQDDFQMNLMSEENMMAMTNNFNQSGYCEPKYGGSDDLLVKNVTFVVTEKCNLACTYCYETHKTNARMTKEIAQKAVDLMFDQELLKDYYSVKNTPGVILDFIGGEPLLEIDLMDFIVEYFKFRAFELNHPWQHNYMISISTNGTLYLSKKVQQFLKRNPGHVSTTISIDGNKKLHDTCRVFRNGKGSYDVVERSVKQWVEDNGGRVQTKATISPENIHYMVDSFKHLFDELHVTGGISNWVYEKGWKVSDATLGYNNLKELAKWLIFEEKGKDYYLSFFDSMIGTPREENNNFCGGNGGMLAFSASGQATPCLRFLKYTLNREEEKVIGDVDTGIDDFIADGEWLQSISDITMTSQSPPKCQGCPVTTGCGGCTAYNYDYSGDANLKATFSCKMHRARVLANVFYWNTIYRKYGVSKRFGMNMPIAWALEIISEEEYWMLVNLAKEGDIKGENNVM